MGEETAGSNACPTRSVCETDLLRSLTVAVPFGAPSNERHAEPRASGSGASPFQVA